MSDGSILIAALALSLAGFVQGLTGFGFGLIAMSLLPLVVGVDEAQAVATLTGIAVCVSMTGLALRHVQWSGVASLWVSTMLGVPLGFGLLSVLPQSTVIRCLGASICLMVLFEIIVSRRSDVRLPTWSGWGIGLASGALSGAFNIGGPPLVVYIFGRPWSKEEQVATLSCVFISSGLMRLVLLLSRERIHDSTWISTAWSVLPMLAAMYFGNRLLKYVPQQLLRHGIYAMLLIIGCRYLLLG